MTDTDTFWDGRRQTLAVDFDGVIHSYTTPWEAPTVIPDPPVEGAIEWLHEMMQEFDITIMSSRAISLEAIGAIHLWLMNYCSAKQWSGTGQTRGLQHIEITNEKVPAMIYVDDRGWRFTGPGAFPTIEDIRRKPWNRQDED